MSEQHIGGTLEICWYRLLERAVRLQNGSGDAIAKVFHQPEKVQRLATFILSLANEEPTTKPAETGYHPAPPS